MASRQTSTDTPTIKRIALYARVSTLNGQNPEMQLAELRDYASRRGWTVSGEYTDLGVSGAKDSRPQLNRMLEDAHARKFDGIAVWKLDRLGITFTTRQIRYASHLVSNRVSLQVVGKLLGHTQPKPRCDMLTCRTNRYGPQPIALATSFRRFNRSRRRVSRVGPKGPLLIIAQRMDLGPRLPHLARR
jgi:Resolvase, N terminal domain